MPLSSLIYIISIFILLNILGTLLCLKLYKWDYEVFFNSPLWRKITFWTPIFILFITLIYIGVYFAFAIVAGVFLLALREYTSVKRKNRLTMTYFLTFLVASVHIILVFYLDPQITVQLLILLVGFCSAMSDVCAFFFGKYLSKNPLPSFVNKGKSWEGVGGQIVGAFIGYILLLPVIPTNTPLALIAVIGCASAAGDIFNSIAKRKAGIKDWGNTIPGHGGIMDRLASLSFAFMATFWLSLVLG